MAKGRGASKRPTSVEQQPNRSIWVRLSGERVNIVFSVECDPTATTIDKLKDLVKLECSPLLDGVAAPMLIIKGADGSVLDEEVMLADLPLGMKKAEGFIVEISQLGKSKYIREQIYI